MILWWTWYRLKHIVSRIRNEGVTSTAEWQRLRDICRTVSEAKRGYLYREFSHLFSAGSMSYLFGNWKPVYADEHGPEHEQIAERVTP